MIKVFMGYDPREAIGFHVCLASIFAHSVDALVGHVMGEQRDGTNAFTYARFLAPYYCNYEGYAVFIDGSDMMLRADIGDILANVDPYKAVSVVKHDYRTRAPRKYVDTAMEAENRDYPRKNWSSVMVFNCAHPANRVLTPKFVASNSGKVLHGFEWLSDRHIGELPPTWNVLIGEDGEDKECALAHFTLGIPAFEHYQNCLYADEWRGYRDEVCYDR